MSRGSQSLSILKSRSYFSLLGFVFLVISDPVVAQISTVISSTSRDEQFESLELEVAGLERQGEVFNKIVQLAMPSVVHIEARKTTRVTNGSYSTENRIEEAGAGVIIVHSNVPYVITNRHVIKDTVNENITIQLFDGRKLSPSKVWGDPESDVAVMEISTSGLVPARLGDSSQLHIGEYVLAMGSPFGLSHSVSFGIVSAKGRRDLELGDEKVRLQDFIQTDAAINPGNSGGPLLNVRGEVVGINTAIASNSGRNEGIGFAIPIQMVTTISHQLIDNDGQVERAFLGVHLDRAFSAAKAAKLGMESLIGAHVTGVTPASPAAHAGLRVDDVILNFDGVTIEDDGHLINVVGLTTIGKVVEIEVFRDSRKMLVQAEVATRPSS